MFNCRQRYSQILSVFWGSILYREKTNKSFCIEGRFMGKLLGRGNKKKKFYSGNFIPTPLVQGDINNDKNAAVNKITPRRVTVLNKLFMLHITDLLATGSVSTDVSGWNIEITRVSVNNDYHSVNVYWFSPKNFTCSDLEEKLVNVGKNLRHELSQLRLMGNVPNITFVKDKRQLLLNETQNALNSNDFGETVLDENSMDNEVIAVQSSQYNVMKHDNKILAEDDTSVDEQLPPKPTNVMGLNRAKILEKVKRFLNRTKKQEKRTKVVEYVEQDPFFDHKKLVYDFIKKQKKNLN